MQTSARTAVWQVAVAAVLLLLAAAGPASAQAGYYPYGRRLTSEPSSFGGRQLQSYYYGATRRLTSVEPTYYYGSGAARRLQDSTAYVRPLFGNSFTAASFSSSSAVPLPHFLSRTLHSYGPYYSARRLQTTGARQLSYYY